MYGGMVMATILSFCEGFPEKEFRPEDVLFSEGESTGLLYILLEGEVEVLKEDLLVATVSEPGAMFGEMAILLDIPHTATVKARTACRVAVIERGSDFLESNTAIAYQLARLMAKRVYGTNNCLVDLSRKLIEVHEALGKAILPHQ